MDLTGIGSIFDFGSKIIDKLFPDKAEAERLKLELLLQQQAGEFKELEARYSAIVDESGQAVIHVCDVPDDPCIHPHGISVRVPP